MPSAGRGPPYLTVVHRPGSPGALTAGGLPGAGSSPGLRPGAPGFRFALFQATSRGPGAGRKVEIRGSLGWEKARTPDSASLHPGYIELRVVGEWRTAFARLLVEALAIARHGGWRCRGTIRAQRTTPFLVISLAAKPMRHILRSRVGTREPEFAREVRRTMSPSRSVTGRPPGRSAVVGHR